MTTYVAFALVRYSYQYKIDDKYRFVIGISTNSTYRLYKIIERISPITCKSVIYSAVEELTNLEILTFNTELDAWELKDMRTMVVSRVDDSDKDATGYTDLRYFFFTETFSGMKLTEKNCWLISVN